MLKFFSKNTKSQSPQAIQNENWECAISWAWLLEFTRKNKVQGLSTHDVVHKIISPATKKKQLRYVDLIPPSCVGAPTYFVCHYWGSSFLDLINSLESILRLKENEEKSRTTFLWIDIFAVNQHRSTNQQALDLLNLQRVIQETKIATLVCVDADAKLLTRLWCLYEIWQTIKLGSERLVVVLHKADIKMIERAICDVSRAETTTAEDKERLLSDIKVVITLEEMTFTIRKSIVKSAQDRIANKNESSQ